MKKFSIISFLAAFPMLALAFNDIRQVIDYFKNLIQNSILPLLMGVAVLYFFYGVVTYIRDADDSGKREEGRNFMIYGIIALTVLVCMWGLVTIVANTFGLPANPPYIPAANTINI